MPDDEVAQEAVAVIREAMAATETVGISRLVLSRRERAVLLQPRGKGIVLWTLRYGDELRDPDEVFGKLKEKKAESQLVTLVQKLIEDRSEEHTSELQSLMRISYAVFCLKKKNKKNITNQTNIQN